MDFFELKCFLALAKNLHFAKAAQEVNLSASALSRMINRLEDELNAELFARTNRGVSITDEGKKFAEFASNCLDSRQILLAEFAGHKDEISGTLKVFASVTACYTVMKPFIKKFALRFPSIHLSVETGDPALALDAVKEGRADLAVAAIPFETSAFFDFISVCKSPLVFAASSSENFFSSAETNVSPQEIISTVPLVLPKTGLARQRFDDWTKSRNVKPRIAAETEGNEAVMALVSLGMGIGLVPRIVMENGPYREGFSCFNAGNFLGDYDIGFIQKSKITGSENAKKIRAAVNTILYEKN